MAGVSMPVTRPTGRALVVGSASSRTGPLGTLQRLGFACAEVDDPYAGMAELCRKPMAYRAIILSLAGLYREELGVIGAVKRRWPHVEIWLTHTDGRHAALADAMRLGADGLLSDDGLHRTAVGNAANDLFAPAPQSPSYGRGFPEPANGHALRPGATPSHLDGHRDQDEIDTAAGDFDGGVNEPILTAEELRALLAEQPISLPDGDGE